MKMEIIKLFDNKDRLIQFLNIVEFINVKNEYDWYTITFRYKIVFRDKKNEDTNISNKITTNFEKYYLWDDMNGEFIDLKEYSKLINKINLFIKRR